MSTRLLHKWYFNEDVKSSLTVKYLSLEDELRDDEEVLENYRCLREFDKVLYEFYAAKGYFSAANLSMSQDEERSMKELSRLKDKIESDLDIQDIIEEVSIISITRRELFEAAMTEGKLTWFINSKGIRIERDRECYFLAGLPQKANTGSSGQTVFSIAPLKDPSSNESSASEQKAPKTKRKLPQIQPDTIKKIPSKIGDGVPFEKIQDWNAEHVQLLYQSLDHHGVKITLDNAREQFLIRFNINIPDFVLYHLYVRYGIFDAKVDHIRLNREFVNGCKLSVKLDKNFLQLQKTHLFDTLQYKNVMYISGGKKFTDLLLRTYGKVVEPNSNFILVGERNDGFIEDGAYRVVSRKLIDNKWVFEHEKDIIPDKLRSPKKKFTRLTSKSHRTKKLPETGVRANTQPQQATNASSTQPQPTPQQPKNAAESQSQNVNPTSTGKVQSPKRPSSQSEASTNLFVSQYSMSDMSYDVSMSNQQTENNNNQPGSEGLGSKQVLPDNIGGSQSKENSSTSLFVGEPPFLRDVTPRNAADTPRAVSNITTTTTMTQSYPDTTATSIVTQTNTAKQPIIPASMSKISVTQPSKTQPKRSIWSKLAGGIESGVCLKCGNTRYERKDLLEKYDYCINCRNEPSGAESDVIVSTQSDSSTSLVQLQDKTSGADVFKVRSPSKSQRDPTPEVVVDAEPPKSNNTQEHVQVQAIEFLKGHIKPLSKPIEPPASPSTGKTIEGPMNKAAVSPKPDAVPDSSKTSSSSQAQASETKAPSSKEPLDQSNASTRGPNFVPFIASAKGSPSSSLSSQVKAPGKPHSFYSQLRPGKSATGDNPETSLQNVIASQPAHTPNASQQDKTTSTDHTVDGKSSSRIVEWTTEIDRELKQTLEQHKGKDRLALVANELSKKFDLDFKPIDISERVKSAAYRSYALSRMLGKSRDAQRSPERVAPSVRSTEELESLATNIFLAANSTSNTFSGATITRIFNRKFSSLPPSPIWDYRSDKFLTMTVEYLAATKDILHKIRRGELLPFLSAILRQQSKDQPQEEIKEKLFFLMKANVISEDGSNYVRSHL